MLVMASGIILLGFKISIAPIVAEHVLRSQTNGMGESPKLPSRSNRR